MPVDAFDDFLGAIGLTFAAGRCDHVSLAVLPRLVCWRLAEGRQSWCCGLAADGLPTLPRRTIVGERMQGAG